jgi:hypothetical protein
VDVLDDRLDVVERPCRADVAGQGRQLVRHESDLPVLVLDVDLDRVQPVGRQSRVVVELPGESGERRGDVDAAHLAWVHPRGGRLVDDDRLRLPNGG